MSTAPAKLEDGTVIRWKSSGRFTYAAIKTPAGWFTTARDLPAAHVPQVASDALMGRILARQETTDVQVAVEWASPAP